MGLALMLMTLLFLVWREVAVLEAVKLPNFYPFGSSEGDHIIPPNDDGSSGNVPISIPFPFFGQDHHSLFVNTNGVISFLKNVNQYTPDRFPLGDKRRLVAPFWADVDTRVAGEVFYRQTTDQGLLQQATADVTAIYVNCKMFRATSLLIATWYEVAFYGASGSYTSKRNTFQTVLVTDSRNSFVIFNYNKLTWTTGKASSGSSSGLGGTPAQAGFNGGDGLRYFNIPGSGTRQVLDLSYKSNVGTPGRWLYRIDSKPGDCDRNGTAKPCPYGKIGQQGNCFVPVPFHRDYLGEPNITYVPLDPGTAAVTLKCEVPFNHNIQSWKNITYHITWYSEGSYLKTDVLCGTLPPDTKEYDNPCPGKPLISFLRGSEYNLNRWISCNVTARYTTSPFNPWCNPKTVREPFFAGLKVSPTLLKVKECSLDIRSFTITPTIPIAMSKYQRDKYLKISFWLPNGIELDNTDCEVEMKDLQPISVRVIARCTTTVQATGIDKVIIPKVEDVHSAFWNRDFHLPSILVSVESNTENIHLCGTYTDPHYRTFPRFDAMSGGWGSLRNFAFMGQGDFILYRNPERNFEVHTRLWKCWSASVTCNCGVVLRDHNDVIEFNCCNERLNYDHTTPIRVKVRSKKRLAPGISITQTIPGFNSKYQVLFPSGVKVTVGRQWYGLDVYLLTPRAKHIANETGLCLPSNLVYPVTQSDINNFGNKFRIKSGESLFDRLPPPISDTAVEYDIPCSCYRKNENGKPECLRELPMHFPNVMDQTGTQVTITGEDNTSGRRKRNVEYTDDLTDEDFELFKRNVGSEVSKRHKRASSPKPQFSKDNATRYCMERLSDTDTGKLCAKLGANLQELVSSCSIDLELTGDTSFAISAVSLLMNDCGEIAGRNMSSYVNESSEEKPEVPTYPTKIIEHLCPNDCTFNGRCVNRSCICNEGYTAEDCAIPIYQKPDIAMLQGAGLCDRRKRPCRKVTVMGNGFLNSTNMTCHVTEFAVINGSWTPNNTEIRMRGVMKDLVLVDCHLPDSPVIPGHFHRVNEGTSAAGLVISMSNDGDHKSSKSLTFISYDSACMSCNVSNGCVLKNNSCFINRYCFAPNEPNPIDLCYQCLPEVSNSIWTKRRVNHPPRFTSTSQYYALSQENLELTIDVSDPEGMPVTLSLMDGSPSEAVMRDNILLWNSTSDANTHVFLKAKDACQAFSTLNITVSLVACQCLNGNCVPHPNEPRGSGYYACYCASGFTGVKCETNIDDCQSYPCSRGRCIDGLNNFTCICDHGYVGRMCDTDYDDCISSPCVHGNCTDYTGAYRCTCDPGYGGQTCTIDINECQSSPCRHGACVDGVDSYTCQCQNGYTGYDCDVDVDECQSSPCVHGTCVDVVNTYTCNCNVGFTGPNCDVITTNCTDDSCFPSVTCFQNNKTISCGPCPFGLTGDGKNCKVLERSTVPSSPTGEGNLSSKPTTTAAEDDRKTDFEFEIRLYKGWDERLRDQTSDNFKELAGLLKNEILKTYSGISELKEVTIISMRPGSIVVDFKLTFNSRVTVDEALAPLKKQTASGKLGSLEVDPNSLKPKIVSQDETKEKPFTAKLPFIIGVSGGSFVFLAVLIIFLAVHRKRSNSRAKEMQSKKPKDENIIWMEEKGLWNEGMESVEISSRAGEMQPKHSRDENIIWMKEKGLWNEEKESVDIQVTFSEKTN